MKQALPDFEKDPVTPNDDSLTTSVGIVQNNLEITARQVSVTDMLPHAHDNGIAMSLGSLFNDSSQHPHIWPSDTRLEQACCPYQFSFHTSCVAFRSWSFAASIRHLAGTEGKA